MQHASINPPHHDGQDVLSSGLVVQPVGCVHHAGTRVDPEQPHANWVHAAIDREAQAGAFVGVGSPEPQQLQVDRRVLRNTDVIGRLREDGRVVVAVLDSDEHLERQTGQRCKYRHRNFRSIACVTLLRL